jgi:hypothetical protein
VTRPRDLFPVRPFDPAPQCLVESAKRLFSLWEALESTDSPSSGYLPAATGVLRRPELQTVDGYLRAEHLHGGNPVG